MIHVIIQPVCVQVVCMSTPHKERFVGGIVIFVIIPGKFNGKPLIGIPLIFSVQGNAINQCPYFKMGDEYRIVRKQM